MNGKIFDIQRFSLHDGPGIRTTVFLKGCCLRCQWCHNPEGLEAKKNLRYIENLCICCGKCLSCTQNVHTIKNGKHVVDFSKCIECGECVKNCPAEALILYGKEVSSEFIASEVLKDKEYYENGGGVTFSGGEALLQADFVIECIKEIKKHINNINICIDTCGNIDYEIIKKTVPFTDIYLYDLKCMCDSNHTKYTGVSNKKILENLKKLDKENKDIWIRIPLIPDVNDSNGELGDMADFIQELKNVKKVTLIPYHSLGYTKYAEMGMEYKYDFNKSISEKRFEEIKNIFLKKGIKHEA